MSWTSLFSLSSPLPSFSRRPEGRTGDGNRTEGQEAGIRSLPRGLIGDNKIFILGGVSSSTLNASYLSTSASYQRCVQGNTTNHLLNQCTRYRTMIYKPEVEVFISRPALARRKDNNHRIKFPSTQLKHKYTAQSILSFQIVIVARRTVSQSYHYRHMHPITQVTA